MAKNFPKLMKDIESHIQEAQQTLFNINTKKSNLYALQ